MDRRTFLTVAGAAAGAAAAERAFAAGTEPAAEARRKRQGTPAPPKGRMKVGCQRWGSSPEKLPFLLRCGVRHICASPAKAGPDGVWTVETLRQVQKTVADHGMGLDLMYLGVPRTVLVAGDARDRAVEKVQRAVRRAGEAGIPALQYNLHVRQWKPRTGHVSGRGGTLYSEWDLAEAEDRRRPPDLAPIGPDEMWRRITYFLERVVPVATEAKVRLACHPPDPPMPAENRWRIAQVLGTVEGQKRFVTTCESPYHGLTFCQGCFSEMVEEPAEEIFDIIRWFGGRGKIFNVHFRNLRGGRDRFVETFPDDGDVDMARAVLAYKEVGYTGMLMPDHVPKAADDPENLQGFAFAYGYIKGLIEAVYAAG